MNRPPPSTADLQLVLSGVAFLGGVDVSVRDSGPGSCVLVLPFNIRTERPNGLVSGMTIMGIADVAMWLAIMTNRGTSEVLVTTDMKTAFLKSGQRETITCLARVLKQGKRLAYGTVETVGESSGLLAHHTVTYARAESA